MQTENAMESRLISWEVRHKKKRDRLRKIAEMRGKGMPFSVIGEKLEISKQYAHVLYKLWLERGE
jgi:hypothetical protein